MSIEAAPLIDDDIDSQENISLESTANSNEGSDALSLQAVISNHASAEHNNNGENTSSDVDPVLAEYHSACQSGDLATVKKLIDSHAITIDADFDPVERVTGLHWAAINNKLSVVQYLSKQGADPNFKSNSLNATPLHWAARYGYVYIVDYLLRNSDADVTICDDQGFNALHLAVNSSNIMLVCYILYFVVDTGLLDVDCRDSQNRTPLLWAAYQGDPLTVSLLLKFGANVKLADDSGFTSLHWGVVKGQVQVLKHLIKDGQADFFSRTTDGKDCFDIGNELSTMNSLQSALLYSGFDKNGYKIKRYLNNERHAKLITFLSPLLIMVPIFYAFGHWNLIFVILFSIILGVLLRYGLIKFVLPSFISGNRSIYKVSLSKSPLVAGIFFGSLVIVSILWFWKMFTLVFWEEKMLSILVSVLFIVAYFLFIQLLESNPGIIEPETDHDVVRTTITDLLSLGRFDTKNFCIETQVRKPIRSKFSTFQQRVITRFDHFCPWIYNDVGLMNHKKFVWFISCIELAIIIFIKLCLEYFDEIEDRFEDAVSTIGQKLNIQCALLGDDELCYGYTYEPVVFLALAWSTLQLIWVTMLFIIQWVQIVEGVTNYEFSLLSKKKHRHQNFNEYFNSAPEELLPSSNNGSSTNNDDLDENDESEQDEFGDNNINDSNGNVIAKSRFRNVFKTGLCCKIIGMEPWMRMFKDRHKFNGSLNTLYGGNKPTLSNDIKIPRWTNVKDFWLDSDYKAPLWIRLLESPKYNKALLNGQEVDYSTLYDLPISQNLSDIV
ncbi:palmitoyltransferase Akr1p [Monosporozyma unispora]|nr:palmitoyltransferase akr1 [Kazachstania unispora]